MDPNFSFQSSTHFSDMFGAFEEFYNSNAMSDVMVSVSGKTFNAHRIVLSAGSDYFRNILSEFKDSFHVPVLVINDISPEDIESMIEFLYRGQIVVTRDRVENLRRAASHLCIKGFENFLRKPFSGNQNASGLMSADNRMNGHTSSTTLLPRESPQQQVRDNQPNKRPLNGSESESKRKRNSKQQLRQQQQLQQQQLQQQILLQQQITAVLAASNQSRISKEATHFAEQLRQQQQAFQFEQMVKEMKSKELLSSLLAAPKFQQVSDNRVKSEPVSSVSITPILNGNSFADYCKQEQEENQRNENMENSVVEMVQDLSKGSSLKMMGRQRMEQNRRSTETDDENDGFGEVNYTYEMDPTAFNLGSWQNGVNGHEAPRTAEGESDFDEEDEYDNESIANRENQAKLAMILNNPNLANLMKHSTLNGGGIDGRNGRFFQCEQCTKNYFDEEKLQLHVKRVHGSNKLNICNICGKMYAWKSGLYKHKRHVHNIGGKTLNPVSENVMLASGGGGASDNQSMSSSTEATSPPMTPTELVPPPMMQSSFFARETVAPEVEASFSHSAPSMAPAGSSLSSLDSPAPQQQQPDLDLIAEQQPLPALPV